MSAKISTKKLVLGLASIDIEMKKEGVIKSYRTLWQQFEAICRSAGSAAKANHGRTIEIESESSTEIVVRSLLLLSEWKYKVTTRHKTISILIRAKEHYAKKSASMTKSTVQVMYLEIQGNEATPLLAVHYDFETPPQDAHPIFHAQLGTSNFSDEELKELNFNVKIQPTKANLYSNVRIPTPCMNLSSVLLGLAADHLEPVFYGKVLKAIAGCELVSWPSECSALQASLDSSKRYLHSYHWYA